MLKKLNNLLEPVFKLKWSLESRKSPRGWKIASRSIFLIFTWLRFIHPRGFEAIQRPLEFENRLLLKRYFQLLEVMIAMLLIVCCVAPALHIYINMYKHELNTTHHYQADHRVRLLHAKIVEKMYKNEIPFESILAGMDIPLQDEELKKFGFKGHYTLKQEKYKKNKKTKLLENLVDLDIILENIESKKIKTYHFVHFVESPLPTDVSDEDNDSDEDEEEDAEECQKNENEDE